MSDASGNGNTWIQFPRDGTFRMSDELLELLRQRVAGQYYDQPQVVDVIARAILHSRDLYPA